MKDSKVMTNALGMRMAENLFCIITQFGFE